MLWTSVYCPLLYALRCYQCSILQLPSWKGAEEAPTPCSWQRFKIVVLGWVCKESQTVWLTCGRLCSYITLDFQWNCIALTNCWFNQCSQTQALILDETQWQERCVLEEYYKQLCEKWSLRIWPHSVDMKYPSGTVTFTKRDYEGTCAIIATPCQLLSLLKTFIYQEFSKWNRLDHVTIEVLPHL